MVRFGHSALDQFIPHRQGKWNVYKAVAVDVTNFAMPHAVFRATKTMWRMFNFFPAYDFNMDLLSGTFHRHGFAPA